MDDTLGAFTARAFFDLVAAGLLGVGLFFMLVGAIGVVRLPDAYHRIHAASMCTTLGLSAMILAAAFHIGDAAVAAKGVVTIVFLFAAMPVGSHLLAKAAHHGRSPQWPATASDELTEDKADPSRAVSDDVEAAGQSSSPQGAGETDRSASSEEVEASSSDREEPDLLAR